MSRRARHALPPALWLVAAVEVRRAVQSDDRRQAILARKAAERALGGVEAGSPCPDPQLFTLFETAAREWARRFDASERDRLSGPVLSLANAVEGLVRKPAQQALPGLMKGVPADDR